MKSAAGVPAGQVLNSTFNVAMLCSTVASPATTFFVTGPGATPVAGTVTSAGVVATYAPNAAFNAALREYLSAQKRAL
ncbi:MAG: Ig-like domain-containing protein [Terracidiphilus sp.]